MDADMTEDNTRRTFLKYSGAVGALTLAAGCLGDDDDKENGEEAVGTDQDLHPRYGYPSTSLEDDEPVESDHTIKLQWDPSQSPPEFYFDPAGLAIESGDVVRFEFLSPDHAVTAFHEAFGRTHRVPEDAAPVSSPMMETGTYWLCEFEESGVWDLYCPPHEFFSMGMRLVVDEATGPATEPADPDYDGEARQPEPELAKVFNADALDPETILEEGDVPWEDVGIGADHEH